MRVPLLLCALLACLPARAGLFADEESRKQVKQLETRIVKLEENDKLHTQNIFDLQSQLEQMSNELRKLRGENEDLRHSLEDAEKRQKDFYVDLDNRLRRFESSGTQPGAAAVPAAPIDPVAENHDYDAAYALLKGNKHQASVTAFQDFLKKYPDSTLAPNAYFWMGVAYYGVKDYKNAVNSYLAAADKFPASTKAPSALLGAAICYQEMNDKTAAKKTLQKLIKNYPDNEIIPRAKSRLEKLK